MFFIIVPFSDIGKHSFRVSNHYLGKDNQKNGFISWVWEISYCKTMMNGEFIDNSLPKHQLKRIYKKIHREKIPVIEKRYLNKEGECLLHDIFNKLGSFTFSIYEEDKEPSTTIQFIDIHDIKENLHYLLI